MPQWRKLHPRIQQSLDVNDMPDDFHRLLWSWLPLGLDREGRILDNAALVKARVMPLREDVSLERVQQALDWYAKHGADETHPERTMIVRYTVNGRGYFYVPNFDKYQGWRGREGLSIYPAPPGQEQVSDLVTDSVTDQVTDQVSAQNRIRTESEENRIESEQNQNRGASRSLPRGRSGLRPISDLISPLSLSDSDSDLTLTDAARIERAIHIRERAERRKLPGREEGQMRQWANEYTPAVLYEATRRTAFKKPDNFGGYLRKTLEQIGKPREGQEAE